MRRQLVVITVAITVTMLAVACSSDDDQAPIANRTASSPAASMPEPSGPTVTAVAPVVPEGFERVAATVTKADGETCEICLWLAETPEQRVRGLMFVTDLGNADGMAFVYERPRQGNFWMKNTVMPLSIAFFGADGAHLTEFDMEPCATDSCPRYRTARDMVVAVETPQGELAEIGIGPGSSLELTDLPCP